MFTLMKITFMHFLVISICVNYLPLSLNKFGNAFLINCKR